MERHTLVRGGTIDRSICGRVRLTIVCVHAATRPLVTFFANTTRPASAPTCATVSPFRGSSSFDVVTTTTHTKKTTTHTGGVLWVGNQYQQPNCTPSCQHGGDCI